MRKAVTVILLVFLSIPSFSQLKKGYDIDVKINGLRDSSLFFAYHLGDKQYIRDTVRLDGSGHTRISGQQNLPEGIYMIVLPGRKYFEILISGNQNFGVTCTYNDYLNTLKFTGSAENSAFVDYQRKWLAMQQAASEISKRLQNNKSNRDSVKILTESQKAQEQKMIRYLKSVISENGNNLLATLVKAIVPLDIPDFKVPPVVSNPDSMKRVLEYNYNKDHFFDNVDLADSRLVRTPILYGKLNTFFTNIVIPAPDTVNKEIDKLIKKCTDPEVFQFVSVYLFNHFRESQIMGHDAIVVKLADDIYLSGKATWVSKEFKDDLRKQVDLIRPNLIGKKAQDLIMDSYKGIFVSLYDIEKDFTILYFWEPDCGHCKEATPKLKAWYEKAKNENIEVFAICTTSDKAKWTKYIEDNKQTWINGWDPERKSRFDYYYNVQSTPMVYILDKTKKIIAKKISVEDIGPFIENYRKYFKQ